MAADRYGKTGTVFIANLSQAAGASECAFRVSGMELELWDPVHGGMRMLTDFKGTGVETRLTLNFAQGQSGFVVFRKKSGESGSGSIRGKALARGRAFMAGC